MCEGKVYTICRKFGEEKEFNIQFVVKNDSKLYYIDGDGEFTNARPSWNDSIMNDGVLRELAKIFDWEITDINLLDVSCDLQVDKTQQINKNWFICRDA